MERERKKTATTRTHLDCVLAHLNKLFYIIICRSLFSLRKKFIECNGTADDQNRSKVKKDYIALSIHCTT